jgi:hypothetical protein
MDSQVLDALGTPDHSSTVTETTVAATRPTAAGSLNTIWDTPPTPGSLPAAAAAAACIKPKAQPHHPQQPLAHRAPSKRQAHKGTFSRILQHQHEEDAAYAEFEAAVKRGSKPGSKQQAAAQAQQQQQQPVAVPAQPAVAEGGVVVVKRKRGRPPKPRPLIPIPTRPLLYGEPTQLITTLWATEMNAAAA